MTDLETFAGNLAPWVAEARKMREYRAWWAHYDPVSYLWLCRAERRGAVVPWSDRERAQDAARR